MTWFIWNWSARELDEQTEDGWQHIKEVIDKKTPLEPTVMVVANQLGYDHTFGTLYYFIADTQPFLGPH